MQKDDMKKNDQSQTDEKALSRRKFMGLAAGATVTGGLVSFGGLRFATAETPVNIVVNGAKVDSTGAAIIKNKTLVPLRTVSEALGAKVDWEGGTKTVKIESTDINSAPQWPWKYVKLDPEEARKRGYDYYYTKGGCMAGTGVAILSLLKENVGYPYTMIPDDIFRYGAGGSAGWGTLCGSLNGAALIMNMVLKEWGPVVGELNGWYTEFPFPTDKHEAYCKFPKQVTTVSKSPLCHTSVTIWANAAGDRISDPEKADRCAKLSGDVAAKAIELLNQAIDGNFKASFKPGPEYALCNTCHTGKDSTLDNQQGKMNCVSCHDDHTK